MLIGNQNAKSILEKYIQKVIGKDELSSIFLLVIGLKHIGKTTMILDIVNNILGNFVQTDFLYVRDCSEFIGKRHILKIELSSDNKKQFIEVDDGKLYEDIGVREITKWLQQASIGSVRILFIENIERMNNSAFNAFLKVSEEPLKNRIILASTSNSSMVLDTILSRSIHVKFQDVGYDDLMKYCDKNGLFENNLKLREFICRMVMGKPGLLHRYQNFFDKNNEFEKIFLDTIEVLLRGSELFNSYKLLIMMNDAGILDSFLDGWIAYSQENNMFKSVEKWLKVKKMLNSNVNIENLLLYGLL